jgi:hypothetical protein
MGNDVHDRVKRNREVLAAGETPWDVFQHEGRPIWDPFRDPSGREPISRPGFIYGQAFRDWMFNPPPAQQLTPRERQMYVDNALFILCHLLKTHGIVVEGEEELAFRTRFELWLMDVNARAAGVTVLPDDNT